MSAFVKDEIIDRQDMISIHTFYQNETNLWQNKTSVYVFLQNGKCGKKIQDLRAVWVKT